MKSSSKTRIKRSDMIVVMGRIVRVSNIDGTPVHSRTSSAIDPQAPRPRGQASNGYAQNMNDVDSVESPTTTERDLHQSLQKTPQTNVVCLQPSTNQSTKESPVSEGSERSPVSFTYLFPPKRWHIALIVVLAVLVAIALPHLHDKTAVGASAKIARSSSSLQSAHSAVDLLQELGLDQPKASVQLYNDQREDDLARYVVLGDVSQENSQQDAMKENAPLHATNPEAPKKGPFEAITDVRLKGPPLPPSTPTRMERRSLNSSAFALQIPFGSLTLLAFLFFAAFSI